MQYLELFAQGSSVLSWETGLIGVSLMFGDCGAGVGEAVYFFGWEVGDLGLGGALWGLARLENVLEIRIW